MVYFLLFREKQVLDNSKSVSQVDAGGREDVPADETAECG